MKSYYVIPEFTKNTRFYIIASLTALCGYGFSFIFDATSIENKHKNVFIISTVCWGMYVALNVYFFVDDTNIIYYWNPFEQYNFQYSRINFKSVFISSQVNLCLFMLKPIFYQINQKLRRCIRKKKNANQSVKDDASFVQRSYVLHKRPHIHWMRYL